MKAVCWQGANKVQVETVPDPKILNPLRFFKVTSTAICGSDLHIYGGYIPRSKGDIIGHEFMEIVEVQ